jgi:hypothetical protein
MYTNVLSGRHYYQADTSQEIRNRMDKPPIFKAYKRDLGWSEKHY